MSPFEAQPFSFLLACPTAPVMHTRTAWLNIVFFSTTFWTWIPYYYFCFVFILIASARADVDISFMGTVDVARADTITMGAQD